MDGLFWGVGRGGVLLTEEFCYVLEKEERQRISFSNPKSPAILFKHTKEKYSYNNNAKKIAMLLILSELVKRIEFKKEDKQLFEDIGHTFYANIKLKLGDMKIIGKKVLLEQAIIALVSNWETYFSCIVKKIFDDDEFISRKIRNRSKLRKFLKKFNLFQDYQELVILNQNKFNGLNFGTYIIENRKINFQNLQHTKILFNLLLDIDLVNKSNSWNELNKFSL